MPEQTLVADSAPAKPVVPQDPASAEYADWRLNGQIPEPSEPATPQTEEAAPRSRQKTAPASETGEPIREPRPSKADARLRELLDDLKRAGIRPDELKTFKREASKPAEAPKAPEQPAKPADEPLKRPKIEDFKTFEDYDAAREAYYEDRTKREILKAIGEDRQRQAQEIGQREMAAKLKEATKRYGDGADRTIIETAKSIFTDAQVDGAVKAVLNGSKQLVDVMYVMGSDAAELQDFLDLARTNPGEAIRKAVLVERLVQEELSRGSRQAADEEEEPEARDTTGRFQKREAPVEKKQSAAPPPPHEVSGRSAPPGDEEHGAVKDNDFRRFMRIANSREIARRKGIA